MKKAPFPVSDHCDGRRFFSPYPGIDRGFLDILKWKLTSRPKPWPKSVTLSQQAPRTPAVRDVRATWINHATFLIETPQGNFLTDPIFSPACGPFGRLGPSRVHPPGVSLDELPDIHYVLLSHDHYDHCDRPSLRQIAENHDPVALAPLGHRDILERAGFSRIVELDWWENHSAAPNLTITLTPSRHWSNRLTSPRFSRLWGGFYVHAGARRLYFAGDTGYEGTLFSKIGHKLGAPDLAMLPIGAYEPRWFMHQDHCNPQEAVQIHRDLGSNLSVAMHWGAFRLTDEGREEPVEALQAALANAGLSADQFRVLEPGGQVALSD
ncbi:MAG: MBL fold metallo-hydrolase [Nibricoccus sp.]